MCFEAVIVSRTANHVYTMDIFVLFELKFRGEKTIYIITNGNKGYSPLDSDPYSDSDSDSLLMRNL